MTLSGVVKDNNEVKFDSLQEMIDFVKELQKQLGCRNILVKGGHHPWVKSLWKKATEKDFANEMNIVVTDILYEHQYDKVTVFESSFVKTMNSHGTGCTLSSAIAANLAKGSTLSDSIILSIDFIHKSMDSMVKLGHGNGPLNHVTYKPESISSKVIQGNNEACATIDSLFLFLKTHPKIIEKWKRYTEHPFVKKVATNQLPYDQFIYFLKQDYFYLINYAQIYCLAAAKSPTYQVTLTNARVVENVVNEIERHKAKLKTKYNIEYDGNTDIQPGPACIAYCEYLLEAGRNEDYLGIKVALAPCLFGYHEAGLYGKSIQIEHKTTTFGKNSKGYIGSLSSMDEVEVYDSWLNDYVLDWYTSSYNQGEFDLNKTFKDTLVSKERIEQLVNSFVKVTELEISFWDEVLQQ